MKSLLSDYLILRHHAMCCLYFKNTFIIIFLFFNHIFAGKAGEMCTIFHLHSVCVFVFAFVFVFVCVFGFSLAIIQIL